MLKNHPLRFQLTSELHARPFTPVTAPLTAAHLAIKKPNNAAERDPAEDVAHLVDFIERHGGPLPDKGAQHYSHDFGRFILKWERHTEFVSYTFFVEGAPDGPFDGSATRLIPADWLEEAPGLVVAAVQVHVETVSDTRAARRRFEEVRPFFTGESLAAAYICEEAALLCGDFRLHEDGFTRFAILICDEFGPQRLGRAVQRVYELETYRAMSMLTLPIAREIAGRLSALDRELADVTAAIARGDAQSSLLDRLTGLTTEVEALSSKSAFRFGAAGAYADIVQKRIEILRETRVGGYQLFGEFMSRRYSPAMRTCRSAEERLAEISNRAGRAADLLRTKINMALQEQNQNLLVSMNRRAGLQLRLQETVEGLSVVAISYYAVSLVSYVLAPLGKAVGVDKTTLTAVVALPVIAGVWLLARRVKKRLHASEKAGEGEAGQH